MAENSQPSAGIGDTKLSDLFGLLGKSGGIVGWIAAFVLAWQTFQANKPQPPAPVVPPPVVKPNANVDVPNAIGRISMGNVGCTATIIGPVKDTDTTISVLTAAHCINVGQVGTMQLKDGRKFTFRCVSRNADADWAWLTADRPGGQIPYAVLAQKLPEKGSPVWHQGYGVDKPGNVERGTFEGVSPGGLQCVFTLSVSSGDSGGGIIATADGAVLSPVCCTQFRGAPSKVWGASPLVSAGGRPGLTVEYIEPPSDHPTILLPHPGWPAPPTG